MEYSEDKFVAALTRRLPGRNDLVMGPGDDCAVVKSPDKKVYQLLKTDCIVEGIHFLPDTPPGRIGRKALARNISDIAAMGGQPDHALITLGLPATPSLAYCKKIYTGIRKLAQEFGVAIVGGETTRSGGPLFLSVALTGHVENKKCIFRSGGRPDDVLYVTGRLGGSLRQRHLLFVPRVPEARWLTLHFKIRAMMDLSDGLAADLPRLARASGTGYCVDFKRLPRSPRCSVRHALTDGEDYELLFAISPKRSQQLEQQWASAFPDLPLTRIGKLTRGKTTDLGQGYDHLKK